MFPASCVDPGIPKGTVCDQLTGTIDVLPTIAAITGEALPANKKIDGLDVSALWKGTANAPVREEFVHYTSRGDLEGLRQGNWKILVKKPRPPRGRRQPSAAKPQPQIMLFDLSQDIGEQKQPCRGKAGNRHTTPPAHGRARR